jgi:rubrerythrin
MIMDLATFGAILSHALDLEGRAAAFYEQGAQGELEEFFSDLAKGSEKRARRAERTRREGVAEMILEPITGMNSEAYEVDLEAPDDPGERLEKALALETASERFYRDASEKMPVREVARTFQRMAKENQSRQKRLEAFQS